MKNIYPCIFFLLAAFGTRAQDLAQSPLAAKNSKPSLLEIGQSFLVFEAPSADQTLAFGRTPQLEMGYVAPQSIQRDGQATWVYTLDNLQPATCYYAAQADGQPAVFVTKSTSSGVMQVYFNRPVDVGYADPVPANYLPGEQLFDIIKAKINAAITTVDVAAYNTNRPDFVAVLTAAANRGVRVRYVTDIDESNTALNPNPVFPLLRGAPGSSIRMHNKFIVIDADLSQDCWVVGGSMNFTDGNITDDLNNVVFVQDQSLALAYEMEFEEMWGSSGAVPNAGNSRFGDLKQDNTPHQFNIDGKSVELYFSPSDGTSSQIVDVMNSANSQLLFSLLTFTYDPTAIAICASDAAVRGLIDNINDTGSEFGYLTGTCGLNVRDWNDPGQFHHKYGVVDANQANSDPTVITGSHNWSASAENNNDENTLIIHDYAIANQFRQEFEARWCENLNLPNCYATSVTELPASSGLSLLAAPDGETLNVLLTAAETGEGLLSVFSVTGQAVSAQNIFWTAGQQTIALGAFARGAYVVQLTTANASFVAKVIVP